MSVDAAIELRRGLSGTPEIVRQLRLRVEVYGTPSTPIAIVDHAGPGDATTVIHFCDTMEACQKAGCHHIALDFSELRYCNSTHPQGSPRGL